MNLFDIGIISFLITIPQNHLGHFRRRCFSFPCRIKNNAVQFRSENIIQILWSFAVGNLIRHSIHHVDNQRGDCGPSASRSGGELNNQAHSLIYSDGDFAFGGQLDDQYQDSGKGKVINNHSAYMEAMGEMRLAADTINNVNDHFETEIERISQTPMEEYQVWRQRYSRIILICHNIQIQNDKA
ncbi:hypothetical protein [Xenorhabdus siamensis]|uniref:hypothetical protein n=1 Tax=Xenorhabdus siamensis TaxID=3136254 RepID=UPI0030F3E265